MTKKFFRIDASIKWGSAGSAVPLEKIPDELKDLKFLLQKNREDALDTVGRYLTCCFIPSNLNIDGENWSEIFDFDWFEEIWADRVYVQNVSLQEDDLPAVRASANFDLPIKIGVTTDILREWEEKYDMLDNAVVFEWKLPGIWDEVTDYDMVLSGGAEVTIVGEFSNSDGVPE